MLVVFRSALLGRRHKLRSVVFQERVYAHLVGYFIWKCVRFEPAGMPKFCCM